MSLVVILQSLPQACPVCRGDEQVDLRRLDGAPIARVPCPHCQGTPNLPALIATPGAQE